MRIEFHSEIGGFWALRPEWNDLLHRSRCNTLFLTWEWQATWWKHLGEGRLLLLGFRSEEDGRLVGIAPLFHVQEENGKATLNVVGCREISDYLDLIIERGQEDAVYGAFLDYLEQEAPAWDLIDCCNLPETSLTFTRLQELAQARGYQTRVEVEDVCPVLDLPSTWEEYLMTLDKKQRHEVRRKLRKAELEGKARFYIVESAAEIRSEMLDFIALHQKSTPEKDQFMDPQMQQFFLDAAQVLHERGWLQLAFMEMHGEKAASLLNFDYDNAILVYNSGYDPARFSTLSPGIVIVARCIEHAIALGREKFDFLRGDEVYKYRFGAQNTQVRRLLVAQPGVSLEPVC